MWYYEKVSIPYSTDQSNPVKQTLEIEKGIIEYIEVEIPAGHVGLTGLYITYNTIQIVPFNKDGFIYGNNHVFHIPLDYKVNNPPYELEIIAWNDDDTYPHAFGVGVMMKDKAVEAQALVYGESV